MGIICEYVGNVDFQVVSNHDWGNSKYEEKIFTNEGTIKLYLNRDSMFGLLKATKDVLDEYDG